MRIAVEDAGEDLIAHIRIGEFGISPLDLARYIQSGGPLFAINSSNGEGGGQLRYILGEYSCFATVLL
jgi:hypothetical protein